jgi:fatty acid desaturase
MSAFWNLTFLGYFYICDRWYFYFVVWLFPVLTTMVLITVLHTLAEHQPDAYDGDPRTLADQPVARTTLPNPLEKWIFFQTNFNYHFEHHAFPTIPCHALPVAHAALRNAGFYVRYPELLQPSCLGRVFRLSRRQRELRNAIA